MPVEGVRRNVREGKGKAVKPGRWAPVSGTQGGRARAFLCTFLVSGSGASSLGGGRLLATHAAGRRRKGRKEGREEGSPHRTERGEARLDSTGERERERETSVVPCG